MTFWMARVRSNADPAKVKARKIVSLFFRFNSYFNNYLLFHAEKGEGQKGIAQGWTMFDTLEKRKQSDAYLFHHEFLYVVCNTQNRVEQILNNHKLNLRSELYYIN